MNRKYDTFWPRFAAGLWDGLIFMPLAFINVLVNDHIQSPFIILWEIIYAFARPVYTIWMHGKYGQTVGKFKTGIIVINVSEDRAITYKEAAIRESPYLIMILFYLGIEIYYFINPDNNYDPQIVVLYTVLEYAYWLWYILELLTMFLNDKRRALHDYLAKCVVVRTAYVSQA